jgi:hypothetical protein
MEINRDDINQHLGSTIGDLRSSYEAKGIKASGKWGESLEHFIEEEGGTVKVGIKALDYIEFSEYGRGPNKAPSVEAAKKLYPVILEWAKVKGITVDNLKAFSFRTALKIVFDGIQVPNKHNIGGVISDVITEDWVNKTVEVVGNGYKYSFESDIIRYIKTSWQ